jgi:hypothetical protein
MKKELEKAVYLARQASGSSSQPLQEQDQQTPSHRENDVTGVKMTGMRAKLYHDVQTAEVYNTSISLALENPKVIEGSEGEEEDDDQDDGLFTLSIHQLSCSLDHSQLEQDNDQQVQLCWLFNAGSGSISDRSYESVPQHLEQILEWKFFSSSSSSFSSSSPPPPVATVTCNDHLCFEFFKISTKTNTTENDKKLFIGSVILPIEDLLHSNLSSNAHINETKKLKSSLHCIEETIMSDDAVVIGQMQLQFKLQ